MPALLQGQASVLTQTPLSEEGRLLPNDRPDYKAGLACSIDNDAAHRPLRTKTVPFSRRISCLLLVRFLELAERRTNTSHFTKKARYGSTKTGL